MRTISSPSSPSFGHLNGPRRSSRASGPTTSTSAISPLKTWLHTARPPPLMSLLPRAHRARHQRRVRPVLRVTFAGNLALSKTSHGRFRDILDPVLPHLRLPASRKVNLKRMNLRPVQLMRFWAFRQLRRTQSSSNRLPQRNFNSARSRMIHMRVHIP